MLKFDKFTLGVIAVVALVLVGAVITVNVTGTKGWGQPTYLDEDTPEAAVLNAFVAFLQRDYAKARQYYTSDVLEPSDNRPSFPGEFGGYYPEDSNRRLRIVDVEKTSDDEALVTISIDFYSPNGPFGGGTTWSSQRVLKVVRENGAWKIATPEFFY
jgi:hypothetical protein